ncbi:MAG: hypothetical protein ABIK31_07650 [candidate division WOR-3 bacterium]
MCCGGGKLIALQEKYDTLEIFKITNFIISENSNIGDTILISLSILSNTNDTAIITSVFTDDLFPTNKLQNEYSRSELIPMDSGSIVTVNYSYILGNSKNSDYILSIEPINKPTELIGVPRITLQSHITWQDIIDNGNETSDEDLRKGDIFVENLSPQWSEGNNTILIKGTIHYFDYFQTQNRRMKSPYTRVRLWFNTPNDENPENRQKLYHPIGLQNNNYIEGTHYADCDDDGNFTFEFSFNKSVSIGQQLDVWLMVCKENDAIKLTSPSKHYAILLESDNYELHTFLPTLKITLDPNATNHTYILNDNPDVDGDNKRIIINSMDGQIFRFCTLSKRFVKDRFNLEYTNLPFNQQLGQNSDKLPRIDVVRKMIASDAVWYSLGKWDSTFNCYKNPKIYYTNNYLASRTIIHEYGHYLDHCMDNLNHLGSSLNTEAFAMFYSTAVMAYANNKYNDEFNDGDNCEIAPFYLLRIYQQGNPPPNPIIERFGNLNKINLSGNQGKLMCRFASFLWQLYDSKDDACFMPKNFTGHDKNESLIGKNNDDVDNLGLFFFNFWNQNPNMNYEQFKNTFRNSLENEELKSSIDKLYDFMDFDLDGNFSSCNPAQLDNFTHFCNKISNNLLFTWQTKSYTDGAYSFYYGVQPSTSRTFSGETTTTPFNNLEDGYRVYLNDELIATLDIEQNSYFIDDYDCEEEKSESECYKITSYKNNSNSMDAPIWCANIFRKTALICSNLSYNNEINVIPNPFSEFFALNFDISEEIFIEFKFYDYVFNHINHLPNKKYKKGENTIIIEPDTFLANGLYFITAHFQTENGNRYFKILKIQRTK